MNISRPTNYNPRIHRGLYFIQPKLDGVRCLATSAGLMTKNGNAISAPHIAEELQLPNGITLDGELYNHDLPFSEIVKRVRRGDCEGLKLHVFDCYHEQTTMPYSSRRAFAKSFISGCSNIELVPQADSMQNTPNGISRAMKKAVADGYEGIILRTDSAWAAGRSPHVLKLKPTNDSEFEIVDVVKTKNGRLSLVLETDDGESFRCSVGMTADERAELFENRAEIIGLKATIDYQELTERGVPRFPKLKEIRDYE